MAVSVAILSALADDWLEASDDPRERFRVGDWELTCEIASGRWTTLYRARPAEALAAGAGAYAIKLVTSEVLEPHWAVSLLSREWAASSAIASPHVVSVLGGDLTRPPWHLVLPWLSGCDLAKRMDQRDGVSTWEAIWFARQTAQALAAMHAAQWIHGDVSPRNIHVGHDGHVTLIDLGLAVRADDLPAIRDARDVFFGTVRYAAPELFDERPWITPAIDVFSLGCALFECFVGRPPHCQPCDPPEDDAQTIARRRLGPHEKLPPDTAPHSGLAKLVDRMLARDPLRRPTAGELVDELTGIEIEFLANRAPQGGATGVRPTRARRAQFC